MIRRLRITFTFINMLIALVLLSVIFSMVLHFTRLNMEQESIQR
ncbi:sensor histidine kinase, partial [Klebsiella oxytoca]